MSEIETLDRTLFLYINGSEGTPAWLVHVAIGIAEGLIYLIPMLLVTMWMWGGPDRRRLAVKACLVTLLALGMNQMIALVWARPRPFMLGLGHAWLSHTAESSFPSDHVTVFAGIGLALLFGGARRLAVGVLAIGVAVAWARVFLGVHFPFDMVGAVLVAWAACGVVSRLWLVASEPLMNRLEHLHRRLLAWPIAAGWVRS